jgi:hypothetical protein
MQLVDQRIIELQQWLPASAHDELPLTHAPSPVPNPGFPRFSFRVPCSSPASVDCVRKLIRARESAAIRSDADEIGVAELAHGSRAILLSSRPQVATGEAAKNRSAASLRTLALQRVKNLFHRVRHLATPAPEAAA